MKENENNGVVGFNEKRADGGETRDKPKTLHLKVRKLNPVNTLCYLQILGNGMDTRDTSPSVLLYFDNQRFIFNAGDGLQRFCTEYKIKLSKIDHMFFSRVCSETAGGLPGLLLTLAGTGNGVSINMWGPSDFKYLTDAMRTFIPHAAMLHTHCFGPSLSSDESPITNPGNYTEPIVLINDEIIKLSAIVLRPSDSKGGYVSKPGNLSVIYICELPEIKGKFDTVKAVALGLNPGPKYRELQLGNAVMSDRLNTMVCPSDVMGPSLPGPIVFIVDCPTGSHLEELLSLQSLNCYYADFSTPPEGYNYKAVNCIIHLSPVSLVRTRNYQMWMNRFGATQHVIAGNDRKNVEIPILKASARIATRLNYLCPQFFPPPGFQAIRPTESFPPTENSILCEITLAKNLLKYHLRPYSQLGLDRSCIPSFQTPDEVIEELNSEIPEIVDAARQVHQLTLKEPSLYGSGTSTTLPSCLENITREDMEIVLLGTGSSQPSKYRNVSSTFINLFSKGSLLLDCGEGTLGQLTRRYGVEGADDIVRHLTCIWISHIHADHHTGLTRILARRRDLLKEIPHEPLLVIGPRQVKRFLEAYQNLEDLNILFLDCWYTMEAKASEENNESINLSLPLESLNDENSLPANGRCLQSYWKRQYNADESRENIPIIKRMNKLLHKAGLERLVSFPVVHCEEAFGVSIKAAKRVNSAGKDIPGWKLVYSGDTRPCPGLIEAARGATVLIHEATFEDGMIHEAIARNHSTTTEAIETGEAAGAYRIILTHFSQRYPKIPVFDENHMDKTCIAFDMMSVNAADLPMLPLVLPHLRLLFRNETIADDLEDAINDCI